MPSTHRVSRANDIKSGGGKNIYGKFLQDNAMTRSSHSNAALGASQPQMAE